MAEPGAVEGKPAEEAGILPGDKVIKVGNVDLIKAGKDLQDALKRNTDPVVELTVLRNGQDLFPLPFGPTPLPYTQVNAWTPTAAGTFELQLYTRDTSYNDASDTRTVTVVLASIDAPSDAPPQAVMSIPMASTPSPPTAVLTAHRR